MTTDEVRPEGDLYLPFLAGSFFARDTVLATVSAAFVFYKQEDRNLLCLQELCQMKRSEVSPTHTCVLTFSGDGVRDAVFFRDLAALRPRVTFPTGFGESLGETGAGDVTAFFPLLVTLVLGVAGAED